MRDPFIAKALGQKLGGRDLLATKFGMAVQVSADTRNFWR
jgi:hypothetical protein